MCPPPSTGATPRCGVLLENRENPVFDKYFSLLPHSLQGAWLVESVLYELRPWSNLHSLIHFCSKQISSRNSSSVEMTSIHEFLRLERLTVLYCVCGASCNTVRGQYYLLVCALSLSPLDCISNSHAHLFIYFFSFLLPQHGTKRETTMLEGLS